MPKFIQEEVPILNLTKDEEEYQEKQIEVNHPIKKGSDLHTLPYCQEHRNVINDEHEKSTKEL